MWAELPAAPGGARTDSAVAWTGAELVTWGGATGGQGGERGFLADGVAFDPAAEAWRGLAPAPLGARVGAASVWTGTQLFVWGGLDPVRHLADGARYDPTTDSWLPVAPGPLGPRTGARAVWTGTEVVVVGGRDNAGAKLDVAAYDPAQDTWRSLPPLPGGGEFGDPGASVAWTGDRLVVLSVSYPSPEQPAADATLWAADASLDGWTSIELPVADGVIGGELAADDGLLFAIFFDQGVGGSSELHILEAGTDTWSAAADGPLLLDPNRHELVPFDDGVLVIARDPAAPGARYAPASDSWVRVVGPPTRPTQGYVAGGTTPVWTGRELLLPDARDGRTGGGLMLRLDPVQR